MPNELRSTRTYVILIQNVVHLVVSVFKITGFHDKVLKSVGGMVLQGYGCAVTPAPV